MDSIRRLGAQTLKRMQNPAKVLVDRAPGRIGFNEHAETGKPDYPQRPNLIARTFGVAGSEVAGNAQEFRFLKRGPSLLPRIDSAQVCREVPVTAPLMSIIWLAWAWFSNGDDIVAGDDRSGGHKLSAIGSPLRNVCRTRKPLEVRRPAMGQPAAGCRPSEATHQVIPSAHSHPPRPLASPPHLAAGPSRRSPLGGKVRWQKRFVFPARRMRRGLQF